MAGEVIEQMNFGDDDGGDVVVSLPGDAGAVQVKRVEPEGKTTPEAKEDPVEDLKGQFAAMTQRVSAAEQTAALATRQAQEATQRAQSLEGEVVSSQLDTVLSGLAAANAEADAAEREFITAQEAGDFAASARAQRKMSAAEARIQRLNEAKDDLEEAAKRRPAGQQQTRQQPPAPVGDPVERFTQGMSPRSAAWIRSHPECVTDPKLNARMLAAHNLALADDVAVDSDEYFRRIEEGVKVTKAAPAQQQRRPSAPAAPAGGGSPGGSPLNGGGGIEVKLTKGEARSAVDGTLVWNYEDPTGQNRWKKGEPIGLAEMARRKHEGMKAGLYDKSLTEQ